MALKNVINFCPATDRVKVVQFTAVGPAEPTGLLARIGTHGKFRRIAHTSHVKLLDNPAQPMNAKLSGIDLLHHPSEPNNPCVRMMPNFQEVSVAFCTASMRCLSLRN